MNSVLNLSGEIKKLIVVSPGGFDVQRASDEKTNRCMLITLIESPMYAYDLMGLHSEDERDSEKA